MGQKSKIAFLFVAGLIWVAAPSPAFANPLDDPGAPGVETNGLSAIEKRGTGPDQNWNLHLQNTEIVQGDFGIL